jgi:hypothetical protein
MSLLLGDDASLNVDLNLVLSHPCGGQGIDIFSLSQRSRRHSEAIDSMTLNELIDKDKRVEEAMQQLLNMGVELL